MANCVTSKVSKDAREASEWVPSLVYGVREVTAKPQQECGSCPMGREGC
jgi:hypothetical protein